MYRYMVLSLISLISSNNIVSFLEYLNILNICNRGSYPQRTFSSIWIKQFRYLNTLNFKFNQD